MNERGEYICVACGFLRKEKEPTCKKCGREGNVMPLELYEEHAKEYVRFRSYASMLATIRIITEDGEFEVPNPSNALPDNSVGTRLPDWTPPSPDYRGFMWDFI